MIGEGWKGMNKLEKVMTVLTMLYCVCMIVMAALHFAGITELPVYIAYIFLGILMLIQAVNNWKKSRAVAIFSLCAAVIIFAVAICMIFM